MKNKPLKGQNTTFSSLFTSMTNEQSALFSRSFIFASKKLESGIIIVKINGSSYAVLLCFESIWHAS